MSGPERPTLYNSSTPASRASAAREHAPCSRLSWSGGLWGNSKTTCGNCGKGGILLQQSTCWIRQRYQSSLDVHCGGRLAPHGVAETARPRAKTLLEKKSAFFSVSRLGATPNAQHRHRLRKLREFAPWLAGRMEDRFMGLLISGDCRPATNVSATNVSGLAQMTSGNCANPSRKPPPPPLRARHAVPRAGQTGRW